jgi:protein-tyrosine sulfotransferase
MRDENGTGSGAAERVRVTWLDDLAEGGGGGLSPGSLGLLAAGGGAGGVPGNHRQPVFVLSVARSGSTLLRFILDSHPELACPAETNVGSVCYALARLWDLLDPSPESARDGWRPDGVPAAVPAAAAASIRAAVDQVYGRYLARHGKRRWCDKSLDSPRMAGLLAQLYPGAQFICLYRHAMDVVVSAIEASPWGLSGYGFESYVTATPGNPVLAVASCWLEQTTAIIEFQERHPDRCHGVRYEDLVTSPEPIADALFTFLGLDPVPGITAACLQDDHDARGPADHKIWFTSQVSTASLGQGMKVPVRRLPPALVDKLNQTLDQLGYRQIDDQWAATPGPADPRADTTPPDTGPAADDAVVEAVAAQITARLACLPEDRLAGLTRRWPVTAASTLIIAVHPDSGTGPARDWTITREGPALTITPGQPQTETPGQPQAPGPAETQTAGQAAITVLAPAATWQALLDGQANLAAATRAGRVRLLGLPAHANPSADLHAAMHQTAQLLGLTAASQAPGGHQEPPVLIPAIPHGNLGEKDSP